MMLILNTLCNFDGKNMNLCKVCFKSAFTCQLRNKGKAIFDLLPVYRSLYFDKMTAFKTKEQLCIGRTRLRPKD